MKTRTTSRTATQLNEVNIADNVQFRCCRAACYEFKKLITEPTYRSQICQHACSKQLNFVMMVYAIPGGIIKRIVIIMVANDQLKTLGRFQKNIQDRYIQDHHTVELYLYLWNNLMMMY